MKLLNSAPRRKNPLTTPETKWFGCTAMVWSGICPACGQGMGVIPALTCLHCALDLRGASPWDREKMLEELAWRIPVQDASALWVAPSGSVAEALYKAFKFGGKRQLGPPLGAMMAIQRDGWLPPPERVIPVPLTPKRMWSRGYNQAAELARGMAHYWSVPVMEHALKRNDGGMNLARLGRKERFAMAATDFVQGFGPTPQNNGQDLAGLRCLLVDDVMTTGATLEQCGKLLVERGAFLSVMVLARRLDSKA